MAKIALITGITGQDGAYLSQFLLERGYEVHGISRDPFPDKLANLKVLGVVDRVKIYRADVSRFEEIREALVTAQPVEIYHLAGQSSVGLSYKEPRDTLLSIVQGAVNILEGIRLYCPAARFYRSGSSLVFSGDIGRPYLETDSLYPKNPYAVAKAAAHWTTVNYREVYGLYACSGILFNHESPLRNDKFVTKKVTSTIARIKSGLAKKLVLGDISIIRDWGYAKDYVEAMWLMLQQDIPEDYIIATGEGHSLKEFVEIAFHEAGLDWQAYTEIDNSLFRSNEIRFSVGNPAKANNKLNWKAKTTFEELVRLMVRYDLDQIKIRRGG